MKAYFSLLRVGKNTFVHGKHIKEEKKTIIDPLI